ncbi:hypothetical protein I3842_05G051200 [Carya illinoinensis]|uniref:Uncharacterized protein n=1 Tax=Carya illinoinensis TaxID=32201 RepID=A0A922EZC1_CARIL|nr:hypothetical protein I3842_05G051200 [Carya illinoinensis]
MADLCLSILPWCIRICKGIGIRKKIYSSVHSSSVILLFLFVDFTSSSSNIRLEPSPSLLQGHSKCNFFIWVDDYKKKTK